MASLLAVPLVGCGANRPPSGTISGARVDVALPGPRDDRLMADPAYRQRLETLKGTARAEILQYLADCGKRASEWLPAAIRRPADFTIPINETRTYEVEVQVDEATAAGERGTVRQVRETGTDVVLEDVAVQCVLSARLVPPAGDTVTVENTRWVPRQFTPSGSVNWIWNISAKRPGTYPLRVELDPALSAADGSRIIAEGDPERARGYPTRLTVDAPLLTRARVWTEDNWGKLVTAVGALGVGLLALVKWGGDFGAALKEALRKWRGAAPTSRASPRSKRRR